MQQREVSNFVLSIVNVPDDSIHGKSRVFRIVQMICSKDDLKILSVSKNNFIFIILAFMQVFPKLLA